MIENDLVPNKLIGAPSLSQTCISFTCSLF